jgi:alkanesulfonate monooxygenase SsuD/methylene tetrahydromethanopterin reductase-like flavin-dependent oxidoreductase (luciferase family)
MAAYVPAALRRVAQYSDGWMPVGIPLGGVAQMFDGIKEMAQEFGRDPEKLDLLVRANLEISDSPIDNERADFTGTLEQIKGDITATRELGATDLLFDVQFSPGADSVDQMVEWMEQLWQLAR